jgi:hypothetical protein
MRLVANSIAVKACLNETWRVPQEKVEIIYNVSTSNVFAPVSRERQARAKRNLGYEGNESVNTIVNPPDSGEGGGSVRGCRRHSR